MTKMMYRKPRKGVAEQYGINISKKNHRQNEYY